MLNSLKSISLFQVFLNFFSFGGRGRGWATPSSVLVPTPSPPTIPISFVCRDLLLEVTRITRGTGDPTRLLLGTKATGFGSVSSFFTSQATMVRGRELVQFLPGESLHRFQVLSPHCHLSRKSMAPWRLCTFYWSLHRGSSGNKGAQSFVQ